LLATARIKEDFQRKLAELVADPSQGRRLWNRELYVFLRGSDAPEQLAAVREQTPRDAFLLCLHAAGRSGVKVFPEGDTISAPCSGREDLADMLLFAMAVLKTTRAKHACEPGLEPGFDLKEVVEEALRNVTQSRDNQLVNLRCCVHNLPSIASNAGRGFSVPPDVPALVCGAGPSIIASLPGLRRAAPNAVVVSLGRIAPILLANGIVPDFVVQVDHEMGLNDWADALDSRSVLLALASSAPTTARRFKRVVWAEGECPGFNLALKAVGVPLTKLRFARTAMVSAIDFAAQLGCRQIALLGSDLCLSPAGKIHPEGYLDESFYQSDHLLVDGSNGGKVLSTTSLDVLRRAIDNYLATPSRGAAVYNCSPAGARLEHAPSLRLDDFIDQFCRGPKTLAAQEPQGAAPLAALGNFWLPTLREYAEQRRVDTPSSGVQEDVETLVRDLVEELSADFDHPASPIRFKAFKKWSLRLIAKQNPELAAALGRGAFAGDAGDYDCFSDWTNLPFVRKRTPDGWLPLSGPFLTMEREARRQVLDFAPAKHFDPTRHGVVFFAPGNWLGPQEFAKLHPDADFIVVEPWPDLLSTLIERSDFLKRFPAKTLVVCPDERLPRWKRLYHARRRDWARQGKETLFFFTPQTKSLPEMLDLFAALPA